MKQTGSFYLILVLFVFYGCKEDHLINNAGYLELVENSFIQRQKLAVNRNNELFSVFEKELSIQQREAMKFLYSFMPLSDLADYSGDFFLANTDIALQAKAEIKWGKDIPEEIFLHYVLPIRVNNENLDSFRIAYYDELRDRISKRSIKDAALEINHWCHEKVSYQPADIRTSSPINTILSARGRCGEESTLAVAALRTVGIPARQVYTPRWAHSDDNHAWVEIWCEGKWYYMGACEPEPVLDRGWFTETSRRAMLVNTKSFGAYYGDENILRRHKYYSDVNNLSKYAITKTIYVKVLDNIGSPVENARVEYKLYNYAEFYPLALVPADVYGMSQFETGLGDLLIWASKDNNFDFCKISVAESDTILLMLNKIMETGTNIDFDLSVPIVRTPFPGIPHEMVEENATRINNQDIIRHNYIDSWISPAEVSLIAIKRNIDTSRLQAAFSRSMGNYTELMAFISIVPDSLMNKALSLLEVLPDKDIRDIKASVLNDHLFNCHGPSEIFGKLYGDEYEKYVLNPRISNEMIVGWRSYFISALPDDIESKALADPAIIVKYLDENIRIEDDENYYNTPLTPVGVHELKVSDTRSRSICFVAICRTLGIPAGLEEGRLIPQYMMNGKWIDVSFSDQEKPSEIKGYVKLVSNDINPVPEYYIHFTLARFEEGRYTTLEYDYNRKIGDFKNELALPPGKYMLTTGNRFSDLKILASLMFFDLKENEHRVLQVNLRQNAYVKPDLGTIDIDRVNKLFNEDGIITSRIKNRGAVIIWFDPEQEPTKHVFNDLPRFKAEMDSWGGFFLFLNGNKSGTNTFDPASLKGLPENTLFGTDTDFGVLQKSLNALPEYQLPFVLLSDKDGNIIFTSAGYRIGIGEQILKHVK